MRETSGFASPAHAGFALFSWVYTPSSAQSPSPRGFLTPVDKSTTLLSSFSDNAPLGRTRCATRCSSRRRSTGARPHAIPPGLGLARPHGVRLAICVETLLERCARSVGRRRSRGGAAGVRRRLLRSQSMSLLLWSCEACPPPAPSPLPASPTPSLVQARRAAKAAAVAAWHSAKTRSSTATSRLRDAAIFHPKLGFEGREREACGARRSP